jgi:hypothetical protein
VGQTSPAQKEDRMNSPQLSPTVLITVAGVLALLVLGLIALVARRRGRSRQLAERYGTEYHRTVEELGGRGKAERDLIGRESRVAQYTIRSLSDAERGRFVQSWHKTLIRFVDSPLAAVGEADQLLTEVMRVRGFPTAEFDLRAADLSVDHPRLAESYRAAHDLALKSRDGQASTEDLRQALIHHRVLFEELVEAASVELAPAR